jgi:DNA-binding NarL/FixJ family response regulator
VADPRILKILLVEDDLEDEHLLSEALIEIEENGQWCNWRSANIVQVGHLADAIDGLHHHTFDIVLVNLSLPDSPTLLDSFLGIHSNARGVPIVVLADEADENLAHRLLREGAQDILVKPELECAPLARSIRYAIERQRRAGPELRAYAKTAILAD